MDLVVGAEQKSAVTAIIERSPELLHSKLPSKKPADVEESCHSIITAMQAVYAHHYNRLGENIVI